MNTKEKLPDEEIHARFDAHKGIRIRLTSLLIVVVLAAIVIGGYQFYRHLPWIEAIGTDALRTNVHSAILANALNAVISRNQNWVNAEDGTTGDPSLSQSGHIWRNGKTLEESDTFISRATTQFTDSKSAQFSLEVIASSGVPTLIMIEHPDADLKQAFVNDLLTELKKSGVRMR